MSVEQQLLEDYRTMKARRNTSEMELSKERVKNQELTASIKLLREELDELQQSISDFHDALGDTGPLRGI